MQIVDSTQSYGFDISQELTAELLDNLKAGQQSILLLNRRGYHTAVRCNNCQEVVKCPNCSVALTYHSANHRLMCHYCGYSRDLDQDCPNCGSKLISYTGSGTQRIEDELHRLFPQAKILRMDLDTTMSRMSHETKFGEFAQGKYQIMVGTQMVAKGLNFPDVTLVGVLGADQSIFSQDFRGCERAFSLLTQVVGRCGRGRLPGRGADSDPPCRSIRSFCRRQGRITTAFTPMKSKSKEAGTLPTVLHPLPGGIFRGTGRKGVRGDVVCQTLWAEGKNYPDLPLR